MKKFIFAIIVLLICTFSMTIFAQAYRLTLPEEKFQFYEIFQLEKELNRFYKLIGFDLANLANLTDEEIIQKAAELRPLIEIDDWQKELLQRLLPEVTVGKNTDSVNEVLPNFLFFSSELIKMENDEDFKTRMTEYIYQICLGDAELIKKVLTIMDIKHCK